ncbi:hypothetical protein ACQ4PT_032282 [Festuca glaucescens]
MTVRPGVVSGDWAGDPPSPAAVAGSPPISSSERAALGRFWALVDDDLGSGSEGEDEEEIEGGSARADIYLCRSPSPDVGRDLVETASGLARRAEKRLQRQRRQRMAAREFASPGCKAPKPSVTMYGYAIEQLMFFEVPTGGAYKPKVDNLKLVKVTVEGDPMSIPEIAECLKRIVPVENFQWEIYNFHNNVFRVKFPNKSEAQRMKAFRTYPVPDRASDLVFEDWSALEDPLYMLPEVWLRVRGIPADVRTDFLALWAVGTLFGKTKEVDMVHTRKNKELRLRIGCLDHTLIPETTDVFIQRGFFKLSFEVEPVVVTQLDGIDMVNNGDNDDGGGNDASNDDLLDGAKDMDVEKTMNNQQPSNVNNKQKQCEEGL